MRVNLDDLGSGDLGVAPPVAGGVPGSDTPSSGRGAVPSASLPPAPSGTGASGSAQGSAMVGSGATFGAMSGSATAPGAQVSPMSPTTGTGSV